MNVSKISLSTQYQKALAAVEGLQKDQRSADTKLPKCQLRLKLRRNTGISEYNCVPSQSCCITKYKKESSSRKSNHFIFFYSCQPDHERIKKQKEEMGTDQ